MDLNRYEVELLIKGLNLLIQESQRELNKRNKYIKYCKDKIVTSNRRTELAELNKDMLAQNSLKERLIKEMANKLLEDV